MPRFGVCQSTFFGMFALGVARAKFDRLATLSELRRDLLEYRAKGL